MLPFLRLQQVRQAPPDPDGVPLQVLSGHDVQDGESDGARDRVPAELRDLDQRRGAGEGGAGGRVGGAGARVGGAGPRVGGSGLTVLKYSIPDEAKAWATAAVVTTQDIGCPLPIGFPMVTMSGTKSAPCSWNAQKWLPTRPKPTWTSSAMTTPPALRTCLRAKGQRSPLAKALPPSLKIKAFQRSRPCQLEH